MLKIKRVADINGFVTTHSLAGLVVMNKLVENTDSHYQSKSGLFSYLYKEDDIELWLMSNGSIQIIQQGSDEEHYISGSIIVEYSRIGDQ